MQLTKWYPPHIKPVRVGVYQAIPKGIRSECPIYSYWNGLKWCWDSWKVDGARTHRNVSPRQNRRWRGMVKPTVARSL
jgi:hypothetical protein